MDSSIHWNECEEEKRNLLVFPLWQKGMQRAWMDEWLINFARNFLDSRKCVFALLCLPGIYLVEYELLHVNVYLRLCCWSRWLLVRFLTMRPIVFFMVLHSAPLRVCPIAVYINVTLTDISSKVKHWQWFMSELRFGWSSMALKEGWGWRQPTADVW